MSDWDILFRGGKLVSAGNIETADVAVIGEQIAAVGVNLAGSAKQVVDAAGAFLLPGIIDAHVHFNEPGREYWEGISTGSRSLAAGGGAVFFDMPLNASPPTLDRKSFIQKRSLAEQKSVLDFGLWGGLTPVNLDHMDELAESGVIGFKAFMSESGTSDFRRADAATLRQGMKTAAKWNLPVGVHAEDNAMIESLVREKRAAGGKHWRDYLDSRPVEAELAAIRIALELAGETGCALHLVHVSCPEGIDLIAQGKRQGVDVTAETCPHYLLLKDEDLETIGAPAKCAPPLRTASTQEALWQRWIAGQIDTLGSDHSPSPPDMKTSPDFFEIWGGIAGCQHAFPLLIAEAEKRAKGSGLSQFVRATSLDVARRFGIGERKGKIATGYDADLVLVNLGANETVRDLLYKHQVSPYVGKPLNAVVTQTWIRGQKASEDGRVRDNISGRFLQPSR
ncbi:MAG TPA: allantoinase AllB [Chthoniobacterales bacterium]|nr:allantoinase AllB [Chthoniobacterales bacterium]